MSDNNFKYRVQRVLQRDGFKAFQIRDSNCPFELISISRTGKVAGVRCKPHGHITKPERKKLLSLKIPIYVASEAYTPNSGQHAIKIVILEVEEGGKKEINE